MPLTIRRAQVTDSAGIAQVHIASWRSAYRDLLPDDFLRDLSLEKRQASWQALLNTPDLPTFVFVAEQEGGEILGFVSSHPERTGDAQYTAEVGAIYLLPESFHHGIGRQLMRAAARDLLARGHHSLLLWVLKDNTPARRFYEALGGQYLRQKPIQIGGQWLDEVAYGWDDLEVLTKEET